MNKFKQKIHDIIYEADTPAGQFFDIALIVVIILSVILVALETVVTIIHGRIWVESLFS